MSILFFGELDDAALSHSVKCYSRESELGTFHEAQEWVHRCPRSRCHRSPLETILEPIGRTPAGAQAHFLLEF